MMNKKRRLRVVKTREAANTNMHRYWEPMRQSTYKAYKDVTDHKKEMLTPLERAEKILKSKLSAYSAEKERRRQEQEAALRRLAQEESDRKLAEAALAEETGDSLGAETAMVEAEVMDSMTFSLAGQYTKPKAEGISQKRIWTLDGITITDESKVPDTIMGAMIRPVDKKAILALIKATGGTIQIPGIKYEATISTSIRSR